MLHLLIGKLATTPIQYQEHEERAPNDDCWDAKHTDNEYEHFVFSLEALDLHVGDPIPTAAVVDALGELSIGGCELGN